MLTYDVIPNTIDYIITELNQYKQETGCKGVVLGLSGGKDSTVVAMLAKKVWGDNVLALLMPNGKQADISDSIAIAEALNLNYNIVNLETTYNNLLLNIENKIVELPEKDWVENCPKISDKAKTNIPPRLRMTTLYAVAQTLGYRVIGTGNLSESYIGWCTKWGDCACDINPLAYSTCTEVIEMGKILAKEFNLDEKYIVKTPSDGLCGKSDEESFGFTYKQLDNYIREGAYSIPDEIATKIEEMHKITEHKRKMPVYI